MLDPVIIRKIREEERRRREQQSSQIPLYYEPPRGEPRQRSLENKPEEPPLGSTVIEIDM
ncbi:MAG: hypothetical protein IV100_06040 [Myxococcales bacterium]|nr:hypothetical protein [Myxococcales bacterium]